MLLKTRGPVIMEHRVHKKKLSSVNIWCVFHTALSQSLWSLMAKQVLTYTVTAPYTFLSGLILISELLPIPLPVQTNEVIMPSVLIDNWLCMTVLVKTRCFIASGTQFMFRKVSRKWSCFIICAVIYVFFVLNFWDFSSYVFAVLIM